ncbi:MAG: Crp/Fnr family transcriptional regulator [Bacteroidales bacterium]
MTVYQRSKLCLDCADCNRKSELFSILNEEETAILNNERYEVRFNAGENIVKQGTILTHITNLIEGFAKVYIEGYAGRNLILGFAGAYSLMGGPGLYTDNRNHYTVTALEDSTVCFINADNFKKVLAMNSEFTNHFIAHLNQKTVDFFEKMISLTQKQMHGRMADALLMLSEKIYNSTKFEIPLNRQDLADMTAMSKDSAIRVLKEFEKDGIAHIEGRTVFIDQVDALRDLSDHG